MSINVIKASQTSIDPSRTSNDGRSLSNFDKKLPESGDLSQDRANSHKSKNTINRLIQDVVGSPKSKKVGFEAIQEEEYSDDSRQGFGLEDSNLEFDTGNLTPAFAVEPRKPSVFDNLFLNEEEKPSDSNLFDSITHLAEFKPKKKKNRK